MKKIRAAILILTLGAVPLIISLWVLSAYALTWINYCPDLKEEYWKNPNSEWQIASTRGSLALIVVPQGYHSSSGWAADFEPFNTIYDTRDEPWIARAIGLPSMGKEERVRAFSGLEEYWALRLPYWIMLIVLGAIIILLRRLQSKFQTINNLDTGN